jgi:predicted nucleic acid-binding protein
LIDTHVPVSAFAAHARCADLMQLVLPHHDLVLGQNVLREPERVTHGQLRRPAAKSTEILRFVGGEAVAVIDGAAPVAPRIDPADAPVLGYAKPGDAEVFLTGDAKLPAPGAIDALRLFSPRQFWELLRAGGRGTVLT